MRAAVPLLPLLLLPLLLLALLLPPLPAAAAGGPPPAHPNPHRVLGLRGAAVGAGHSTTGVPVSASSLLAKPLLRAVEAKRRLEAAGAGCGAGDGGGQCRRERLGLPAEVAGASPWLEEALQTLLGEVWAAPQGAFANRSVSLAHVQDRINRRQHAHLEALPPAVKGRVDQRGEHGETELHLAAQAGNVAAVRHFLAHGAAPCQPDAFGQSPAHLAAKMGRSDALAALGTVCPGVVDRAGLEARDLLPPPVRPGLPVAWPGGLPGTTRPDDLAEANRLARADAERSGWRQSGRWDAVLEGGRCDLPTVDGALSPEEFERFVLAQRPVRMKGAAKDWAFRQHWTRAGLEARHGDEAVPLGPVPFPAAFGVPADAPVSVTQFLRLLDRYRTSAHQASGAGAAGAPNYVFGALPLAHMPHTAGEMSFLQDRVGGTSRGLVRDVAAEQALVSLGPAGSGAPLHIHADAVNAAAFGRKHWWITPPSKSHFSTAPVQEWVGLGDQGAGGLDPAATFRCTQFPGDVIYVPFDWGHAVLNLDETVGVALEFLVFREHLFPCGDECDD